MAGAGYKLFNTGDVLTAAQVNTYLMQQTIMVFADSTARTTALSGVLAEGMTTYLQDTNSLEFYNGSAWVAAVGDITGVTAGTGLTGGGTSGTVTLTNDMAVTITAKGDLIAGTGNATYDNLAAGSNGDTLVADSAASTGLRWQTGNGLAQGVINGGMDIWQRGTSFTNGGLYTADRWYFDISASTVTSTRESTIVPAGFQYSWKINKSAGSSTATAIQQVIETGNAIQYAGKTVALSVYFAADSATSFSPGLEYSTSADNPRSGSWTNITATVDGTTTVSTTTFVRITSTFAVPSTAKTLRINFAPTIGSGVSIYLTGVQLEIGSVATPFRKAGGTLQGELAACQRYYWRFIPGSGNNYAGLSPMGVGFSSTVAKIPIRPPVPMRAIATSLDYSTLLVTDGTNSSSVTSLTLADNTADGASTVQAGVASGLTQYRPYYLIANNSTSAYIAMNAEL